jgi:hypothetical protein
MKRWLFLLGIVPFFLLFSSCYTVLMVAEATDSRYNTDSTEYEEYAVDEADTLETENTVIHEHYIYGDLWPGYVVYDPFWTSPYWYYYHTAWPYYWADDYYFWGDYNWRYYGWGGFYSVYSPGYYYPRWNYRDPYYTYWEGYYSPSSYQRRPFAHRDALRGSDNRLIGDQTGTLPASDRRLGKARSNSGDPGQSAGMTATSRRESNGSQTGTNGSSRRVRRSSSAQSSQRTETPSSSRRTQTSSPNRSSTSTTVRRPSSSSSGSSSGRSGSSSSGSSRSGGSSSSSGSSKRR